MTDSQILEIVGRIEIGRKELLSVLGPDLLYTAVTCANFHKWVKWPISNRLLNNLDIENDIVVEIIWMNFPGIPHWEKCDFLIFLINFATSMGEVFNKLTPSFLSKVKPEPGEFEDDEF